MHEFCRHCGNGHADSFKDLLADYGRVTCAYCKMTYNWSDRMPDKIQTQRDEFDAVDALAVQWRRIQLTPIVDDDYPAVRHDYESALHALVEKMCDNDRFSENTRGALIMLRHVSVQLGTPTNIYVDCTAKPGGDGTMAKPFQNLNQVLDK